MVEKFEVTRTPASKNIDTMSSFHQKRRTTRLHNGKLGCGSDSVVIASDMLASPEMALKRR